MYRYLLHIPLISTLYLSSAAYADDFNSYILKAVSELHESYSHGGYDINSVFTHDLPYGQYGTIPATHPPKTMCVAATMETLLTAMDIFDKDHPQDSIFSKIPRSSWVKGNLLSLRANIFIFSGTGSLGTGWTLQQFGLGEQVRFQDLRPGDFVNLNRSSGSGHSVIFLSYINNDLSLSSSYSENVKGFRYFSAQGKGRADAGLGYRYGFFGDYCPSGTPDPRDCHIIRSNNRSIFNAGRMWDPSKWDYDNAISQIKLRTRQAIEDANPALTRGAIDDLLETETQKQLQWNNDQSDYFNAPATE